MFEHFSDTSIKVIMNSQALARRFAVNSVGIELLLLGLIEEKKSLAGQALSSCGVRFFATRDAIEKVIGRGVIPTLPIDIPFTDAAKRVLQSAADSALHFGSKFIRTEHLLLGLLEDTEGSDLLVRLQIDSELLRLKVQELMGDSKGNA